MKTKRKIQFFLFIIACSSLYFCYVIALTYRVASEANLAYPDLHITSGYDGGALGMGIICASSLLGIVWLETKK